jgi:hypothetical protein
MRSGSDNNTTAAGFCPDGGGAWPATQALIVFLVTNIFAHAATIRPSPGSNNASTVRRVIAAIFLPVTAGDSAFRALGRWIMWLYTGMPRPALRRGLLRGDNLRDAATAGALAICIPFEYSPLLVGRWEIVDKDKVAVWLDDTTHFWGSTPKREELPKGFKSVARFPRYIPFLLPPDVEFKTPRLENTKIPPESNALSSIIAVGQIFLSVRDLYNNYGSSVSLKGLSSPYLVVIPYFLMSFVNLIAGVFVGSYHRVNVLRMKSDIKYKFNEVYIVECPRERCTKHQVTKHQVVFAIKNEFEPHVVLEAHNSLQNEESLLPRGRVSWLGSALSKVGISWFNARRSEVNVTRQPLLFEGTAPVSCI